MSTDETDKPRVDPGWTDFNDTIEKTIAREESKQYQAARPLRIAKRVFIFCMILFSAAFIGSCQLAEWSYRHDRGPKDADRITLPQPDDAPKYEQPVLDRVKPALLERYGLKEFKVKYKRTGMYILIRTDETRGPRLGQAFGIMEDIREMRRTMPELPSSAWVLEIDHFAPDGGMTFVLPDAKRGYRAFPEWHDDTLYTAMPVRTGKAQP